MRKIIVMVVLFVFVSCAYCAEKKVAAEAEALFEKGEYSKGLNILKRGLLDKTLSALQRAEVTRCLAKFYEETVGDTDSALKYYRMVLRARLPSGHPVKSSAEREISRLKSLEEKYSGQNALLKRLRVESSRTRGEDKIKNEIKQLRMVIKENPEYYRTAEVYYYLGLCYKDLEKYGKAYKSLQKSAELKPGINFYLPVKTRADVLYPRWIHSVVNRTTWGTLGVLLICGIVVFYVSRPWRWVRWGHLAVGLAVMVLWLLVFSLSYKWVGDRFEATETIAKEINAELPAFISASAGSPGSEVTKYLFLYGLVGVAGTFAFCVGMSRFKYRWLALIVNCVFGLLLCGCLASVFYMRYCCDKTVFRSPGKGGLYYLKGNIYSVVSEPEPYILTNPKAYPNLNLSNMREGDFKEWVKKYCPFDDTGEKPTE